MNYLINIFVCSHLSLHKSMIIAHTPYNSICTITRSLIISHDLVCCCAFFYYAISLFASQAMKQTKQRNQFVRTCPIRL